MGRVKGTPRGFTGKKICHPLASRSPKRCYPRLLQHCAWVSSFSRSPCLLWHVSAEACMTPAHALQVVQECFRHSQEHYVHAAPRAQVGCPGAPASPSPARVNIHILLLGRAGRRPRAVVQPGRSTLHAVLVQGTCGAQRLPEDQGCSSRESIHPQGDNQDASPQYVRWLMDQRHFNGRRKRVTKRSGD